LGRLHRNIGYHEKQERYRRRHKKDVGYRPLKRRIFHVLDLSKNIEESRCKDDDHKEGISC
jgi:hypothetical protein